jgi:hypothetical protein
VRLVRRGRGERRLALQLQLLACEELVQTSTARHIAGFRLSAPRRNDPFYLARRDLFLRPRQAQRCDQKKSGFDEKKGKGLF